MTETAVWPIPFLINLYFAVKGSQIYFYLIVSLENNADEEDILCTSKLPFSLNIGRLTIRCIWATSQYIRRTHS